MNWYIFGFILSLYCGKACILLHVRCSSSLDDQPKPLEMFLTGTEWDKTKLGKMWGYTVYIFYFPMML